MSIMGGVYFGRCLFWAMSILGDVYFGRCLFWAMYILGDVYFGRCLFWAMSILGDVYFGRCLSGHRYRHGQCSLEPKHLKQRAFQWRAHGWDGFPTALCSYGLGWTCLWPMSICMSTHRHSDMGDTARCTAARGGHKRRRACGARHRR